MFSRVEPLLYHKESWMSSCDKALLCSDKTALFLFFCIILWAQNKAKPIGMRVVGGFGCIFPLFCGFEMRETKHRQERKQACEFKQKLGNLEFFEIVSSYIFFTE